ncbi:PsiF family protein [Xanthomonas translucens]|uniref:Starvation-inducible protein n=3 Tax=Xanthomonas campestris pv. translucens TaxID=343 RepID=A0A109HEG8_XANCT|nr:PsiF family protein [Xanthomonas translucens]KTF40512.1 starvation-inducible protein [Xanthomonas translucens pv. translucens]KWV10696.1 starvation-inducible protein [Xanthomonas translucens]MCS3358957.1 PsiF family protein [Xanthomonas translucens pv. translucens]MCS3373126.1 PsiF family protein [Xanthomonas translucens pv. translucens]MCT8273450.1 PsiF family protein [Xanthomonas translucens pv. translucens]
MTRSLPLAVCLLLSLSAAPLLADAAATPQTAQQSLMAKCSAQNKGKQGDAYKAAQKACLSGNRAPAPANASQQRMKDCNAQAATQKLQGDARKTFMRGCLKKQ